jgi:hypothetical protein
MFKIEITQGVDQNKNKQTPWLLVNKRNIPTERTPFVGEVSAKLSG